MRHALTAFGFDVVSADGVGAAKLALGARGDVTGALLDVELRDGSGVELYEWITANYARLIGRVAFLTGSAEADLSQGAHATSCPVLAKPFDIADLVRLAAEWEGVSHRAKNLGRRP